MNEYRPTAAMQNLRQSDKWAIGPLSTLGSLARALSYLVRIGRIMSIKLSLIVTARRTQRV